MLIRLLNALGIIRGVWLLDFQGEEYLSIARQGHSGGLWAYVYPFTRIGHVVLNDDKTCSGCSSYITKWGYLP